MSTCSCSVSTFDPTYGFNLDKFGITEEEIYTQHEAWPVRRRSGGMKDIFAVNRVCIVVYPFANNNAYTPEDFAFLGCTEIIEEEGTVREGWPSRELTLYIDAPTKQDVLDAMDTLLIRPDIYRTLPYGWIIVD